MVALPGPITDRFPYAVAVLVGGVMCYETSPEWDEVTDKSVCPLPGYTVLTSGRIVPVAEVWRDNCVEHSYASVLAAKRACPGSWR